MIILERGFRNQCIIILIVPEPCVIYMAKWEIIAREFLTVAYIIYEYILLDYCFGYLKEKHCLKNESLAIFSGSNHGAPGL